MMPKEKNPNVRLLQLPSSRVGPLGVCFTTGRCTAILARASERDRARASPNDSVLHGQGQIDVSWAEHAQRLCLICLLSYK
jgi:hypothetical protein